MRKQFTPELPQLLENGTFPSQDFVFDSLKISGESFQTHRNVRFKYEKNTDLYMYADTDVDIKSAFQKLSLQGEESLEVSVYETDVPNFYNRLESGDNTFGVGHPSQHEQTHRYVVKTHPLGILKEDNTQAFSFYSNNLNRLKLIGKNLTFNIEDKTYDIAELDDIDVRDVGDYSPTHKIVVKYASGVCADYGEVCSDFFLANDALTLVTGQYPGSGHLVGFNTDSTKTVVLLGFTRCDSALIAPSNWFRTDPSIKIENIFIGFEKLKKSSQDYKAVKRGLHYYRASNTASSAREVALVSSCSGVEAVIGHYLSSRAGWTQSLVKKSTLAERMTAAAALIELDCNILSNCPELLSRSLANNHTGFEVMALFRNKLVHSVPDFEYNGKELLEAHNLFQWFLEMLLLAAVGYAGGYVDRRIYSGFTQTHDIPYFRSLLT